jgi:hypothetical protein
MAEFVAGDTNSKIRFTFKKASDGSALDLSGATVDLRWKIGAGILTTSAMTVTDAAGGVAEYLFTTGQLVAGTLTAEGRVTSGGKFVTTLEQPNLIVRAALA